MVMLIMNMFISIINKYLWVISKNNEFHKDDSKVIQHFMSMFTSIFKRVENPSDRYSKLRMNLLMYVTIILYYCILKFNRDVIFY